MPSPGSSRGSAPSTRPGTCSGRAAGRAGHAGPRSRGTFQRARALSHGRVGLLAGLFAVALTLRPQIVGLGPLIPEIQADLGVSHAVAGLLSTIPVACMGLFAPAASYVAGGFGTGRAIGLAVVLLGGAGLARALAPGAPAVLTLTLGVGIGIAIAGALMPVAVRERLRDRPASATGVYVGGINTGSAVAAATAVPLAAAGSWRTALVVFSAVSVGLALLWLVQERRLPPLPAGSARPAPLPVRSGVAWLLVTMFFLLGVGFYGVNAWLPDAYVERGWSEESAGALLADVPHAPVARCPRACPGPRPPPPAVPAVPAG